MQAQFPSSDAYSGLLQDRAVRPDRREDRDPLETDASGTWVGSSYLWASVGDWARLRELMLNDGQWDGQQVLPAVAGTGRDPGAARR
ncbi:MAG: hypothetical protein U0R23_05925 [Candidatus Nanopelagicales bacterium]